MKWFLKLRSLLQIETNYIMKHILYEEFVKRHNTHQTHIEDLVLLGPDGIDEIKDKVKTTYQKKVSGFFICLEGLWKKLEFLLG